MGGVDEVKIVVGAGSFSLSNEAKREYLRRTGREWTEAPMFPDAKPGDPLSSFNAFVVVGEKYWSESSIERTDPVLVAIVEEWGDRAAGWRTKLMIVSVPKGTFYRIHECGPEDDEIFETRDGIDWSVA